MKEKRRTRTREWARTNRHKRAALLDKYRMKSRYNITPEQKEGLIISQKGQCAICRQVKELVIDHCHKAGKYRALLCRACNLMIGYAHDNPDILESAIHYLDAHSTGFTGCGSMGIKPYEDKHAACA